MNRMNRRSFRPSLQELECRTLQSSVAVASDFPHDYHPLRPVPVVPDVATGITFTLNPITLGTIFGANLTYTLTNNQYIVSTQWSETITYGGFTTPVISLPGGYTSTQLASGFPGTYTVQAYTTYGVTQTTSPPIQPPAPTTVTNTIRIPPPDTVEKDGGVLKPVPYGTALPMTDTVTAGGFNIGPAFPGFIQEDIPLTTMVGGAVLGGNGWGPPAPSPQFNFSNGVSNDQFMYVSAGNPPWNQIAPGTVLATFTQQLRFAWTMSTNLGTNELVYAPLNSLTWTWEKTSSTDWTAF